MGRLIEISPIWSENGDGMAVVATPLGDFDVVIVGSPSSNGRKSTEVKLKTVLSLQDLLNKNVVICGEIREDEHKVIAERIEEY